MVAQVTQWSQDSNLALTLRPPVWCRPPRRVCPHGGKRCVSLSHFRPWTMAQWGDAYPLGIEPKAGEDGSPWATRFWGHSDSQEYTPIVRGHGGEVVVGHPRQEKGVPAAGHASRAPDLLSFLQGRGLLGPSLRALPHLVL